MSELDHSLRLSNPPANKETVHTLFENQLLNYKQAARYLSISTPYLRRLKNKGSIPWVPVGPRGVRFRVRSLDQWVEKREIK